MVEITEETFAQEAENAGQRVLLDFYASWCGPCKALAQTLEALCGEPDWEWKICKINIDENPSLTQRFHVMSVPTLIVMENGEILARKTGAQSAAELRQMMLA